MDLETFECRPILPKVAPDTDAPPVCTISLTNSGLSGTRLSGLKLCPSLQTPGFEQKLLHWCYPYHNQQRPTKPGL